MNKCIFQGNLTRDPELRSTSGGVSVVNFGLAMNRRFKRGEEWVSEPTFVDCEAWDSGADAIANHLKKGDPLLIEASVKNETWEKDGEKRSKIKFRVERFYFIGSKRRDESSESAEAAPAKGGKKSKGKPKTEGDSQPDGDGGSQDIPF